MMRLPDAWNRWLKIGIILPVAVLNGWVLLQVFDYFEPILSILVLAAVLAFILNYPVRFLQQRGIGRNVAIFLVLVLSLLALTALTIILIPVLLQQFAEIATLFPSWIDSISQKLQLIDNWIVREQVPISLSHLVAQLGDRLPNELETFSNEILIVAVDAIDSISEALLTLVLTVYLLLDGERLWRGIFQRLPLNNRDQIQRLLHDNFHRYFIGQVTLGLLMGTALTLVFFVLNVPYSLLLGLAVGLMTLIPFGDTISFILVSLLVAVQNLGLGMKTLVAAAIVDQIMDQIVAPRVLGGFTGLRPIWVIIALLVGAKIGGLPGLLIAVPMASFASDLLGDPFLLQEDLPATDAASVIEPHQLSEPASHR